MVEGDVPDRRVAPGSVSIAEVLDDDALQNLKVVGVRNLRVKLSLHPAPEGLH